MITVNGKLYLVDVGAHENVYEDVSVGVHVTFSKGKVSLGQIDISNTVSNYIESVGSSVEHWTKIIESEFKDSGDYVLDSIVENLSDDEYSKAETYITAYYKDHPMPDGVEVELIPIQDAIDKLFEEDE